MSEHEIELDLKPLTGWTDFASATNPFSIWKESLVITRVDKAANCLCIMCKACYVRLATEEMEGPGYSRVEGVALASIKSIIENASETFYDRNIYLSHMYVNRAMRTPSRLS